MTPPWIQHLSTIFILFGTITTFKNFWTGTWIEGNGSNASSMNYSRRASCLTWMACFWYLAVSMPYLLYHNIQFCCPFSANSAILQCFRQFSIYQPFTVTVYLLFIQLTFTHNCRSQFWHLMHPAQDQHSLHKQVTENIHFCWSSKLSRLGLNIHWESYACFRGPYILTIKIFSLQTNAFWSTEI